LFTGAVSEIARIRRPIGAGHFGYGLSHYPFLVLAVVVVVVAVVIYANRRP
jgi:hypothetical protein